MLVGKIVTSRSVQFSVDCTLCTLFYSFMLNEDVLINLPDKYGASP